MNLPTPSPERKTIFDAVIESRDAILRALVARVGVPAVQQASGVAVIEMPREVAYVPTHEWTVSQDVGSGVVRFWDLTIVSAQLCTRPPLLEVAWKFRSVLLRQEHYTGEFDEADHLPDHQRRVSRVGA